ncbi:MAG: DNA polymerase III subunit gamma/tau [Butyrivibrio sp.]|nr:DNA polymerase III subunit gamma/tau [Butyrivibrio sp.]
MLYNLYRPTDFSEVKGQEDVLLTLKKQSQTSNFGHAYLLAGHRGTGKTTLDLNLSKAVNCEHPSANGPCKACASCLAAKESLDILELDAASNNGVDKIKEMMAQAKYRPVQLRKKVFIIDEVHNLSTAAFDVLLKPLEEPPSYCVFILCTTELHKIPVTIRSRCEEYVFHPISAIPMKERLQEVLRDQNATCDDDALNLIVRNANGGLRDALGLTEQLIVSTDGHITAEVAKKRLGVLDTDQILDSLEHVIRMDTLKVLCALDSLIQNGKSPSLIIETTLNVLTDIITLKSTQSKDAIMHSRDYVERLWQLSGSISFERLYWMCEQYCLLRSTIRNSINPALDIRLTLIRISSHDIISADPVALAEEVAMLKKEVAGLKQGFIPAKEMVQENTTPDHDGFSRREDLDIPFCTDTEEEYLEEPDNTDVQKGVMPSDRTEADTILPDQAPEAGHAPAAENISASDLFKMLS